MSIDTTYIKSAIETLDLIQQLFAHLRETQTTNKFNDFLSQIESKAVARISSSLGQKLGINIPVADQEGKSSQYWKGVRDMAKLAKKQFLAFKDDQRFTQFLVTTQNTLSSRIEPEKQDISPLEELLSGEYPIEEITQPVSPLEEILTEPTQKPFPASITVPEPEPVPKPTPKAPTPTPKPAPKPEPIPAPIPKAPTPTPKPAPKPEPIPAPTPKAPIPTPKPITEPEIVPTPKFPSEQIKTPKEPISPITPTLEPTPQPRPQSEPLPDRFQALDEALKTSGLEQPVEKPVASTPSLKDMLLDREEEGEEKEDDMLSLSLREALKILRDEDED